MILSNPVEKMRNGIKVHNNPCDIDTSRIRTIDGSWSKVDIDERLMQYISIGLV